MALIQILIIRWISDLLARIAVAFACWNFLLFLSLKTKRNCGQKRQLYPYVANESTHNVSCFFFFFFLLKTAKSSESIATFYCIKENIDELSPLLLKTRSLIREMRQLIVKRNEPALECTRVIQKDWLKAQWFTKK